MGRAEALFLPPVLKSERRGVRVVEGARLESVYSGNAIAGSNPALSAEHDECPALAGIFVLKPWQAYLSWAEKTKME
jgi:hypothetical protein